MEPNMGLASCQPRSFHAVDAEFVVVVAVAAAAVAIMHYNFTRGERDREPENGHFNLRIRTCFKFDFC